MFTTFDTFPLFTAFPKDIRLLIWEFSLPEPRIVHVKQAETRIGKVEHDGYYEPAWVMRSYSPIPSLLHVDIEAREVASRFYKPAFQCSFPLSEDAPYIWFDFNRDYFYLTKDTFQDLHGHACYLISASSGIGDLPKADICRIRNLAVDSKMWGRLHNVRSLANILYRLGGVENLTICTDHATSDGYEPPTDDTSTTLWDLRSWDAHGDVQVDVRRCFKKYDLKEDELHPSLARERIPVVKYEKIDLKDLISIVKDVGLRCETTSDSGTGGIIVDESSIETPENHPFHQQEAVGEEQTSNGGESAWEDYNPGADYVVERRLTLRIPNIQYKVFLGASLKAALEKARAEYHLRIKQNVEAHKSHFFRLCRCRRPSNIFE